MKNSTPERPVVVLDHWTKVYAEREHWEPAPGFIEGMSLYYEQELQPTIIVDDETQQEIAAAVESKRPLVFNMSHGHELDTVLGAVALGKTAVRTVFDRIIVLAKDELFRVDENAANKKDALDKKEAVEKIGLPVFQPKKWTDPKYRIPLVNAAKWLQDMVIKRLVREEEPQHVFIHGEGERNPNKDKTKVQKMRALLARIAFGVRDKGLQPIVIPIGIAYRDPEAKSAEGAVVVVGKPMTKLPERQSEFSELAREKVQELVNRGVKEIELYLEDGMESRTSA